MKSIKNSGFTAVFDVSIAVGFEILGCDDVVFDE